MGWIVVMLAAGALAGGAPAAVQGKWSADPRSCSRPQDARDAPIIIHGRTMDQHEASCTFGRFVATGPNRWAANGSCVVEGNKQGRGTYKFQRHGNSLRIQEPDVLRPSVLTRCRS